MFMVVDVLVIRVVVYLNEPSSLFRRDDQDIKNSVGFFDIGSHGEVSSRMSVLYRWFVDKDLQVLYTRVFLIRMDKTIDCLLQSLFGRNVGLGVGRDAKDENGHRQLYACIQKIRVDECSDSGGKFLDREWLAKRRQFHDELLVVGAQSNGL